MLANLILRYVLNYHSGALLPGIYFFEVFPDLVRKLTVHVLAQRHAVVQHGLLNQNHLVLFRVQMNHIAIFQVQNRNNLRDEPQVSVPDEKAIVHG